MQITAYPYFRNPATFRAFTGEYCFVVKTKFVFICYISKFAVFSNKKASAMSTEKMMLCAFNAKKSMPNNFHLIPPPAALVQLHHLLPDQLINNMPDIFVSADCRQFVQVVCRLSRHQNVNAPKVLFSHQNYLHAK
jgi:hypothetical protein